VRITGLAPVRRLAAGIGLQQVVRLERRVDEVTVAVDENAYLARRLERRVSELEASLVPTLAERHEWLAAHAREPDNGSGEESGQIAHGIHAVNYRFVILPSLLHVTDVTGGISASSPAGPVR
jgi:hypothetical protein